VLRLVGKWKFRSLRGTDGASARHVRLALEPGKTAMGWEKSFAVPLQRGHSLVKTA
jgi:hypothetical protein